jgi:hypothetical protein
MAMAKSQALPRRVPRCTVCHHQDLKAIDLELASGESSQRVIARRYCLSLAAVDRHNRKHLKPAVKRHALRQAEQHEAEVASVWTARLEETYQRSLRGADRAAASDKPMEWVNGARFLAGMGKLCETGLRLEGLIGHGAEAPSMHVGQIIVLPMPNQLSPSESLKPSKLLDLQSSDDDSKQKP